MKLKAVKKIPKVHPTEHSKVMLPEEWYCACVGAVSDTTSIAPVVINAIPAMFLTAATTSISTADLAEVKEAFNVS